MVTSPTGKGVIVMGGKTKSGENSKAIFELSSETMQWTRLEQTLQFDHSWPLAIPIPDELVSKNLDLDYQSLRKRRPSYDKVKYLENESKPKKQKTSKIL